MQGIHVSKYDTNYFKVTVELPYYTNEMLDKKELQMLLEVYQEVVDEIKDALER